jgi:hypothetical protein
MSLQVVCCQDACWIRALDRPTPSALLPRPTWNNARSGHSSRRGTGGRELPQAAPERDDQERPDPVSTAAIFAFTSLSMIPELLFFVFVERRIIGGLTGAIKA